MRSLRRPTRNGQFIFKLCLEKLQDEKLAERLAAQVSAITKAEAVYEETASRDVGSLFNLPTARALQIDFGEDMVKLYSNVLSKKSSHARYAYEEIRGLALAEVCPLCAQRQVSTLDHYLEKKQAPVFSVTPINLVPACGECNKIRATKKATGPDQQTLHPYFDDVEDQRWLDAYVVESDPVVVAYRVIRPQAWSEQKQNRVKRHFDVLGLASLYTSQAATELTGYRQWFIATVAKGGGAALREHLITSAESWRNAYRNSWQGAMYEAMSASEWFCQEGYACIAGSR